MILTNLILIDVMQKAIVALDVKKATAHYQKMEIWSTFSDWLPIPKGAPQGSVHV